MCLYSLLMFMSTRHYSCCGSQFFDCSSRLARVSVTFIPGVMVLMKIAAQVDCRSGSFESLTLEFLQFVTGVDPKSVVCEFFRHGQCAKGFKCKYSHDLSVERKGEKIDIYSDQRDGEGEVLESSGCCI
jgi:hypothetical protein